jgi:hypothetical protein
MRLDEALRASPKREARHPAASGYGATTVHASPDGTYHLMLDLDGSGRQERDFADFSTLQQFLGDNSDAWEPAMMHAQPDQTGLGAEESRSA